MKQEVEQVFNNYIREKFKNENVRNYILNHERKGLVLNNLVEEVRVCERKLKNILFDAALYKATIEDVASMFASSCLKYAEEQAVSRLERLRRIDEANRINELEAEVQEETREFFDDRVKSYPGNGNSTDKQ